MVPQTSPWLSLYPILAESLCPLTTLHHLCEPKLPLITLQQLYHRDYRELSCRYKALSHHHMRAGKCPVGYPDSPRYLRSYLLVLYPRSEEAHEVVELTKPAPQCGATQTLECGEPERIRGTILKVQIHAAAAALNETMYREVLGDDAVWCSHRNAYLIYVSIHIVRFVGIPSTVKMEKCYFRCRVYRLSRPQWKGRRKWSDLSTCPGCIGLLIRNPLIFLAI